MRLPCAALAGLLLIAFTTTAAAVTPRRIVSINLCSDLLLLALVERERLVSLSRYATDPARSPLADAATGIPANNARVEEVIGLAPDLVLAGRFNAPETLALLRRLDVPLLLLDVPDSVEQTRAQIRTVGAAVGATGAAERLVEAMDRRLAAVARDLPAGHPRAVIFRANGYTAGDGTLVDDLLAAAGFANLATDVGVHGWGTLDLETLLLGTPRLLVLDSGDDAPSLATASLRHPALARLAREVPVVNMPARLWMCAGPWMVEAVERLADARRALGPR